MRAWRWTRRWARRSNPITFRWAMFGRGECRKLHRCRRHCQTHVRRRLIQGMTRKFAVIFEQAEMNWAAYVPDLPGCVTTGRTLEEAERNIREAISGHLQKLRDFGDPI